MFYPPQEITNEYLRDQDLEDIKQAILNAELDTSSEFRVHIEETCPGDVLRRASDVFMELGMTKTRQRNAVLFYVALKNRKFAIIPDYGLLEKDTEDFWERIKLEMLDYFRENDFSDGLIYGIGRTADFLRSVFPYQKRDSNELPDEISFGSLEKNKESVRK
jgi:uncharacterized membrane protein